MPNTPATLLVLLVLLMQGMFGAALGRDVCVPVRGVEAVAACEERPIGSRCGSAAEGLRCGSTSSERVPTPTAPDDERCGCCVHLPAPEAPVQPQPRSEAESTLRTLALPPAVIVCLTMLTAEPEPRIGSPQAPPDPDGLAHLRALRVTRLLN